LHLLYSQLSSVILEILNILFLKVFCFIESEQKFIAMTSLTVIGKLYQKCETQSKVIVSFNTLHLQGKTIDVMH
jgi:hypothetical protein